MDSFPLYPYAFIQVPAVARRANVDVVCQDLLGLPQEEWPQTIGRLQQRHQPSMFLITLRNTDSMVYQDYRPHGNHIGSAYFPIAQTKALIKAIRSVSAKPMTVGGFGFSLLARELMPILQPNFGVFGGADDFFHYFDDILQGNYRHVANLLYFEGENVVANERLPFPPAPETEYTSQAVEEMLAFYEKFPEPGFQGAPVEIIRGCNHDCLFCAEPLVAGHKVQYRDMAAIMGDIELLASHGLTEICMVMSELNPEGNGFILRLANRIRDFNERQSAAHTVSWSGANYLLTFDREEFQRLVASGFTGGWFDITALDDENAQAMRTPYRNKTLVSRLKTYAQLQRDGFAQPLSPAADAGGAEEKQKTSWSMFLGNPATTMETIRRTMAVAHRAGLAELFDSAHIVRPLRVFDFEQLPAEALDVTFSVDDQLQRVPYQQTLPSFAYPPALLNHLGSEEAIETMFAHISETYLSTAYQKTRDWTAFLAQHAPAAIPGSGCPSPAPPSAGQAQEHVDNFLKQFFDRYHKGLAAVDLPLSLTELDQMTPYTLAKILYTCGTSIPAVTNVICEQEQISKHDQRRQVVTFFIKTIMYRFNIDLHPAYQPLFMSDSNLSATA